MKAKRLDSRSPTIKLLDVLHLSIDRHSLKSPQDLIYILVYFDNLSIINHNNLHHLCKFLNSCLILNKCASFSKN